MASLMSLSCKMESGMAFKARAVRRGWATAILVNDVIRLS